MEENVNTSLEPQADQPAEQTADQPDAFLSGWDDDPGTVDLAGLPDTAAQGQEHAQGPQATQTSAQPEAGSVTEDEVPLRDESESSPQPPAATAPIPKGSQSEDMEQALAQQQAAPLSWTIRPLDTPPTVITANDARIPELLRKGLDYDRVRVEYDEAKPVMEMFSEFARQAGMNVADYARLIRSEAKRAQGMNESEARRAVELEDRETAVAVQEAARNQAATVQNAHRARISADLAEFAKAFPEVYQQAGADPKTIPQSVWDEVNHGLSLTAAYSRYAVAQAQAIAQAERARADTVGKNVSNAERSTGSMKSAGSDTKSSDAFLEGWGS